jgi:hypothetical protein
MGVILSCSCQNCKYSKKEIFLGQGMLQGHFYFPCYNAKKSIVENVDIFNYLEIRELILVEYENQSLEKLKVKDRYPYFLKTMFKRGKEKGKILNKSPRLQSNLNYCPKCKEYMLNFTEDGLFD